MRKQREVKPKKPPRLYRYYVTSSWGEMKDKTPRGTVIIDTYHGRSHDWNIMNMKTGEWTGGFTGNLIEEYFPEEPKAGDAVIIPSAEIAK